MARRQSIEDLLDGIFDSAQDALGDLMDDVREQAQEYVMDAQLPPAPPQRPAGRRANAPPRARPAPQKPQGKTLYDVLECSPHASPETLSAAYKSLMLRFHPDKGGDQRKAQEIAAAYTTLKDAAKRKAYDRTIGR